MARKGWARGLTVGIVVVGGLAIFMIGILVVGEETRLFVPKVTYNTNFPDASGLRVGSPVTMAGVRVGSVQRIVLPTDPSSEGIEVFMTVDKAYAQRVREGTSASLHILQFVANEKSIDLSPGDPLRSQLGDGEFIPPQIDEGMIEKGKNIAATLEQVTDDISEVFGAIRRGEGLLGKAIVDPEFGQEGLETIQSALESLRDLVARINAGHGLAGRVAVDDEFADKVVTDLTRATSSLATVAERIERGEGLIGRLSVGSEGETLAADLKKLGETLRAVAQSLESGEGLAGALLKDEELGRRVAGNLDQTMANLASITRKIDEGEGTIGLLVNDASLYEDVQETITGVQKSKIASWLIRRYHRKGEKEKAKAAAEEKAGDDRAGIDAGPTPAEAEYSTPFAQGSAGGAGEPSADRR